jgi:lipopolysaccharide assembly outer membrane protein LptD (OstA)
VFLWAQDRKLMRLTNFNTSLDFSLSELLKRNKDKKKTSSTPNPSRNIADQGNQGDFGMPGPGPQTPQSTGAGTRDAYGYQVFDVPWTLNMSYSFSYFKTALKPVISQTLSFNGSMTITKKMSAIFTSGYDFQAKVITMTNIGITRDLHCWTMNLNWVPNGTLQSWNFVIRVKASVLGDLKYERRKDYHDSY